MKPILKYRGGKSREIKYFKEYIPKFDTYIEPFFGGGAVYFYLEPEKAILNDVNKKLIDFYRDVQVNFPRIHRELSSLERQYTENRAVFNDRKSKNPGSRVTDPNEKIYYKIRDMYNKKIPYEYAYGTIYFYINKTAYSGMIRYNKNGEYNVPYGRYVNFNTHLLTEEHFKLLSNAKLMNSDYEQAFDKAQTGDFIFLDPPYDTTFSEYGNEVFTGDFGEEEHRRLAADFRNLPCKSMMVIGETQLTSELYSQFIKKKYKKKYSVNIRNRFKSEANHLIITNY